MNRGLCDVAPPEVASAAGSAAKLLEVGLVGPCCAMLGLSRHVVTTVWGPSCLNTERGLDVRLMKGLGTSI